MPHILNCSYKPISEILVDQGQNNVLPLVTWPGISFLASKLHFILMTNSKGKRVQGWGLEQRLYDTVPCWGGAFQRWKVASLGIMEELISSC